MPSAEQQKQASRKLTHWLENEKKIVTFRELSREIGCHVNVAKNLLLDYCEAHSSIAPTYLLTGNLLSTSTLATTTLAEDRQQITATQRVKIVDMDEMSDGDRNSEEGDDEGDNDGHMDMDKVWGNDHGDDDGIAGNGIKTGLVRESEVIVPEEVKRWGVVLVQGDDLDVKKELFDPETLNIHIYALSPQPVKDPAQYLVPNLTLRSHASYFNPDVYGTITGVSLRSVVEENAAKPMKDGAMDFSGGKKESKGDTTAKEEKAATKTKEAPKAQPEPAKPKAAPTSPKAAKPSQAKAKKRIITSDDEEDQSGPGLAVASKAKLEATSSQVRAADAAAMEAMMGMDMDVDMSDDLKSDPVQSKAGSSKAKEEKGGDKEKSKSGVKRKRKVKRTVTTEDAKGYMVTTDRWSETSASASDEEAPPKAAATTTKKGSASIGHLSRASSASVDHSNDKKTGAPRPPPNRPAASNAKKSGQSTLAGFFKKK